MKPEKIIHLKEDGTLRNERKKRVEYTLAENGGKIVSYQPYKSLQLIFYDLHTSDLPDLWKLGFRKGSRERYSPISALPLPVANTICRPRRTASAMAWTAEGGTRLAESSRVPSRSIAIKSSGFFFCVIFSVSVSAPPGLRQP